MDHIRIDEGVKRGAHMPQRAPDNERDPQGRFLPKLPETPEAIAKAIDDYRQGATLEQIGEQYGVSVQAVYSWLLGDIGGEQNAKLVTQALTARIALADQRLDTAPTPLELARAREQARWSRMDLERRRPALYGQKQEVTHNLPNGPLLQINVVAAPQQTAEIAQEVRTIDVTP